MLKNEVELMARMAKTIDGFTQHQTRLAVVIDGLDSCEQDKVLQMLDTVRRHLHFLFHQFVLKERNFTSYWFKDDKYV